MQITIIIILKLLSTQITERDENNNKDWKHIA